MNTQPPQDAEIMPDDRALTLRPAPQPVAEIAPEAKATAPITAAQAKIDAVAHLTMAAYERAATLELTPEESAALQADFPDECFQPGAAGKESLIYIEHAALRQRFNQVFGMGKWAIVPRNRWGEPFKSGKGSDGERIYVEAMLIVRGCFVGEAVGAMEYYPSNASQNYGDAVEGAKTAAFRRCAKEFGVGLQAWSKTWCEGWWQRKRAGAKFAPVRKPDTAPAAPAPAPSKVVTPPAAASTDKTRDWMIGALLAKEGQANRQEVTEYFRRTGKLLPTEEVEDLPLKYVPTSKAALAELADAISGLGPEKPAEVPAEPEEPEAPADDRPHATGIIELISVKDSPPNVKRAWKLYGMRIDGVWYNTFDTKIGEQAQALQGQEATIYYTENERGKTAVEIK